MVTNTDGRNFGSAFVVSCVLALSGCERQSDTTPPQPTETTAKAHERTAVVKNAEASVGDTTTCPFSGKTFVVESTHPRVEYEGVSYWVCSEAAAEQVRADPAKYLADFEG